MPLLSVDRLSTDAFLCPGGCDLHQITRMEWNTFFKARLTVQISFATKTLDCSVVVAYYYK
jgi:hypothetical protein